MICPNCGETLREKERSGVEIDVCPVCRGVWLDRGELDKLMDRERRYYDDDDDGDDWDSPRSERREREYAGSRSSDREYPDKDRGGARQQHPQKKKGFFQSVLETFGEGGEGGGMD
jgi:Zn-finger nucleic acid-binding protein